MTTADVTPALARQRLDIALAFKGGWRAFAADIVPLLVGGLIALALSIVTLGILAGPLFAGLYKMVAGRIRYGRPARIGEVFDCTDRFGAYLAAFFVLLILIGLASLTIVGGVLLTAVWLYVFPLMVDKGLSLGQAMGESYRRVLEYGFWEHVALVLLLMALNAVARGPLGLLTAPFSLATVTAASFVAGGEGELVERI